MSPWYVVNLVILYCSCLFLSKPYVLLERLKTNFEQHCQLKSSFLLPSILCCFDYSFMWLLITHIVSFFTFLWLLQYFHNGILFRDILVAVASLFLRELLLLLAVLTILPKWRVFKWILFQMMLHNSLAQFRESLVVVIQHCQLAALTR